MASFMLLCVGIFVFFILLLLFLLLMRYLNYRENVKMVEKGIMPQQKTRRNKGFLIAGWIITALGLIGTILLWLAGALAFGEGRFYPLALGPWVLLGLVPLSFGLFLLLVYVILTPAYDSSSPEPKPSIEKQDLPIEEIDEPSYDESTADSSPDIS